jgi:RluA family pseudouridine synthase
VPSADGPRAGQVGATGRPSLPAPPLEILFEDEHVLALLKPAGILVQPGPGDHAPDLTSVVRERYAERYAERPFTPSPAHRLDLGTSGLVLFGMSAAGLRGLSESFRARDVDKRYLALVQGVPDADAGEIDLELSEGQGRARAPKTVPGPGRAARTEWTLVARGPAHALLEVRLHTGRLHQIRAHLSALDMPIVGDGRYGAKHETRLQLPRRALLLHAYRLRLPHPVEAGQLELEGAAARVLCGRADRAGARRLTTCSRSARPAVLASSGCEGQKGRSPSKESCHACPPRCFVRPCLLAAGCVWERGRRRSCCVSW